MQSTDQSMTIGQSNESKRPARRRRGRLAALGGIGAALVLATVTLAADPAAASWYGASVGSWTPSPGLNVRDCYHPTVQLPPSANCTYVTTLPAGTGVHIVCQRTGQSILGDSVWDYVVYAGGEGLVADAYMNTGHSNWIPGVDICS